MLKRKSALTETTDIVDDTTATISEVVQKTEEKLEDVVAPVRKSVIKRFPTLFLLLVTLGITATTTGMQQILLEFQLLQEHPSIVLIIGLALLVLTGTLYKKLG